MELLLRSPTTTDVSQSISGPFANPATSWRDAPGCDCPIPQASYCRILSDVTLDDHDLRKFFDEDLHLPTPATHIIRVYK